MYSKTKIDFKEDSEYVKQLNELYKSGYEYVHTLRYHDFGTLAGKTRTILLKKIN